MLEFSSVIPFETKLKYIGSVTDAVKYSSVFICVFGKFVLNNSQMSGEKSLRSLVDMKMMDNPVLSVSKELFQMFRKVIK